MSDYQLNDTVHLMFTTRQFSDGVPTTLAGTPAIDIYEDATATPIVTGETLVTDLNTVTGLNVITITATSGTGFNADGTYHAVIQAGTVGGTSVVGEVVMTPEVAKANYNVRVVALNKDATIHVERKHTGRERVLRALSWGRFKLYAKTLGQSLSNLSTNTEGQRHVDLY